MTIQTPVVALGAAAVLLAGPNKSTGDQQVALINNSTVAIRVGGSDVAVGTGWLLGVGLSMVVPLQPGDSLYAIPITGSAGSVQMLLTGKP